MGKWPGHLTWAYCSRRRSPAFYLRTGWPVGDVLGKDNRRFLNLRSGEPSWRSGLETQAGVIMIPHIFQGFHAFQNTFTSSMIYSENPMEQAKGRWADGHWRVRDQRGRCAQSHQPMRTEFTARCSAEGTFYPLLYPPGQWLSPRFL